MKNIKDYLLDIWFEIESSFFVLLDYHKLPLNRDFCDRLSHFLSHKVVWNLEPFFPDENGKWKVKE